MIRKIEIENFKSVKKLELELGRVTVLIGENGAGKSNILEAIAFAGAAAANKVDNEFLAGRGIRMPDNVALVLSAFPNNDRAGVFVDVHWGDGESTEIVVLPPRGNSPSWRAGYVSRGSNRIDEPNDSALGGFLLDVQKELLAISTGGIRRNDIEFDVIQGGNLDRIMAVLDKSEALLLQAETGNRLDVIRRFLIYMPENRELRNFTEEGQILPLGIRGEGLFRLLQILSQQNDGATLAALKEKLQLIDWYEDFEFQQDAMPYERRLLIRDRHIGDDLAFIDQRSANEGFLFLLFYFCLFLSDTTPPFFAIDNIDSSLNPRLCTQLIRDLVKLAVDNGKQAIFTTHNPAVLDGLDLTDDEQRLYVVRRNIDGETVVDRIQPPNVPEGRRAVPLSEAFMRGYLGGLPNNF